MKTAVSTVDFLGAVIGEGTIKLQPRIIKKIVNFNEEELKTKKGLRSFLGILNYAQSHIPKLGILLRLLYEKKMLMVIKDLSSDFELVRKIKEQVQNLPDLKIPPKNAYIILETDGCMEGWGGIVNGEKKRKGECIGEMKQLAAAALYSVEEVLQCQDIETINSKGKQSKQCEVYKQSYNAKPKSASACQLKTTIGLTKEKTSQNKEARIILIELKALAKQLGRNNI
ncbi:hypothetical protein Tco_0001834 [Tanacetum coccineum]